MLQEGGNEIGGEVITNERLCLGGHLKRYQELTSHNMMDSQYGQGTLRYFFFHGNHGGIPIPLHMSVDAKILVFSGEGQM
ncbi:hypothetical protein ACN38_g9715 [Penicillium nordicum]|uniref:Uncharacterized protein n=1 Tax=Penicillium nordicum TaxID=229535 RepID=A0A0M9WCM1_9EURO|nr:hypothetical protein ACN38_g9715 [Penicillium nordicum]